MSFESNTGLNVSNHYGPRDTGGEKGVYTSQDSRSIYTIDVPETGLVQDIPVKAGAIIENVEAHGTAVVTTLVVGVQDISLATWGTPVVVTDDGNLEGTFTGEGKVTITVNKVAY